MKQEQRLIVMLTAYDYTSALFAEESGIDVLLIGDSLGMVVNGEENTLNVTMDMVCYHTQAVRKGAPNTFIIADLPYMSYHVDIKETKKNAARLITKAGADAVKLEGGSLNRIDTVKAIIDCEIPVVGHLGLTPQSIHRFGGYKVQGKNPEDYQSILSQAIELEKAGIFMLVLEGIPEALGKEITERLTIPTIGIGAGKYTSGQVLVWHDMLGYFDETARFVRKFGSVKENILSSLHNYVDAVRENEYPNANETYFPIIKE